MKRTKKYAVLGVISLIIALAVLFSVSAFAARLPGDMDADGKITAADARIILRISAHLEKIEDYFTPEELAELGLNGDTPSDPVDVNFEIEFSIPDGGYFIGGESSALITITADADITSAQLEVIDAADTAVYKTTVGDIKKNTPVSVEWDGKNSSGEYVGSGEYTVAVGSGEQQRKAEGLVFTAENYFSDGSGSESNPFLINTKEDIENIIRYPKAHFKQVKDIDYDYATAKSMFTEDMPFNGVYDGNGKIISNLMAEDSLFKYVGEDGILKNLSFENGTFNGDGGLTYENKGRMENITVENGSFSGFGGLTRINNGKIVNCTIDGLLSFNKPASLRYTGSHGLVSGVNNGLISGCDVKGALSGEIFYENYGIATINIGGISGVNHGTIINSSTDVNIKATGKGYNHRANCGGIVGSNEGDGSIQNSESNGTVTGNSLEELYCGGIAGHNAGQIKNCVYSGSSSVNIAGVGGGIVA